tara:strand:- start:204 stop:659 length:456 start_codon:yes stop_codon:yes gene_type:complete
MPSHYNEPQDLPLYPEDGSDEAIALQRNLKEDLGLYKGKIDGIIGPQTKEAVAKRVELLDMGLNHSDIPVYVHREESGLPAHLMFTGEYEMWDKYGDNYREQMSDEEYEGLYDEERVDPLDRIIEAGSNLKDRIGEIDLIDRLFDYMKGNK